MIDIECALCGVINKSELEICDRCKKNLKYLSMSSLKNMDIEFPDGEKIQCTPLICDELIRYSDEISND